jgi:hypothetical protein
MAMMDVGAMTMVCVRAMAMMDMRPPLGPRLRTRALLGPDRQESGKRILLHMFIHRQRVREQQYQEHDDGGSNAFRYHHVSVFSVGYP